MKKILLVIMLATFAIANLQAQKKTFTRDYIYQASETDSKVTARAIATTQIRNILLREVGEFLHTERMLRRDSTFLEYAEKIEDITAGIVEMKMLDEQWSATYYIKAEMTVDPDEVNRRITEVLKKTKELEDARKRALAAEAEVARLKKELANSKPNTRPVTAGNKGDVDRYEPPQPKVYEKALFKSTTDGTDEGDERNKIKDNSLYNGSGKNDEPTRTANTQTGFTTSEQGVSFSLQGRSASGGFPKPAYNLQKSGKVVVEIRVDQNGAVTHARATAKGSTLQDATLWKAAEDAARRARFNVDKNAALSQMGTITYIFTL